MTTWYTVGNRTIAFTEEEAEELRIRLQTDLVKKRINDIIDKNKDCFRFTSEKSRSWFVNELAGGYSDMIDVIDCYGEILDEGVFQFARDMDVGEGI